MLLRARRAGDYNLHHVCAYVQECVSQFSLKLPVTHFWQITCPNEFYALQYFWGFCELWPTFE